MKIAVIISGWHFPLHFYKKIAEQKLPDGWSADLFCVSHRDPKYSVDEKKEYLKTLGWSYRNTLDKVLYEKIATVADMESLGWKYMLVPNTMGDWGNTNQWLEKHDYKKYDMLLVSHDDNLILNDRLYTDLLTSDPQWLILTNSEGSPGSIRHKIKNRNKPISIRGSFEFIKPKVLDMIGGKFDLSATTLTREGETSSGDFTTLKNWNNTTRPLERLFGQKGMVKMIHALSPHYRVSKYCVEGERGFISSTQKEYKGSEDRGLQEIQKIYDTASDGSK